MIVTDLKAIFTFKINVADFLLIFQFPNFICRIRETEDLFASI